jgi:Tfp pilus assembly protein PilF
MAARLEESHGDAGKALALLRQGLETSAQNPELHYRIAELMARIQPDQDVSIRQHFEAGLLGPVRNYRPRLAYGTYLFSQNDFERADEQFSQLLISAQGSKLQTTSCPCEVRARAQRV